MSKFNLQLLLKVISAVLTTIVSVLVGVQDEDDEIQGLS